jgi:hypothetical protein
MNETEARDVLSPAEQEHAAWHTSTFGDNAGFNCVEAGPLNDGSERMAVRHSHRPDAEVIVYTRGEWEAFLKGVRAGEFDFFTL